MTPDATLTHRSARDPVGLPMVSDRTLTDQFDLSSRHSAAGLKRADQCN